MKHTTTHPLAGRTVTVKPSAAVYGHPDASPFKFEVEDWNDRLFGRSWMDYEGHPASISYAVRSAIGGLPTDNEVVYGHDGQGFGHLVHVSEIAEAGGDRA